MLIYKYILYDNTMSLFMKLLVLILRFESIFKTKIIREHDLSSNNITVAEIFSIK